MSAEHGRSDEGMETRADASYSGRSYRYVGHQLASLRRVITMMMLFAVTDDEFNYYRSKEIHHHKLRKRS